ncbi:beta-galactosidase trimerization domain-containing protein [Butyrivibrio sp. WCD3002]|uniref:beta-galactosidase trimerization domain-containing protein n=1 Tax=Butyrivibrio sp. WCD3002 TaxID=1280676 RepID=UPI00042378DB|nr:beta-galactosidase trimerization domain-containing protein [Butyrivibrio sp. WCD3002]
MIDKRTKEPYINIIFGNFYCPGYDDEKFVHETMGLIRKLGFNSVMLDTKDSEDFRERVAAGPASQYVKMQEFMMRSAKENGLSFNFLLLYLNGDNLYPHIRFSPPVLGEGITWYGGEPGRWYKYWSEKSQDTQAEHVKQMMELYADNYCECDDDGKTVKPVCSMWDPVVCSSFDEEGINRYREFLKNEYKGDIEKLNDAYEINAKSFDEIQPSDYWYEVRFDKLFEAADVQNMTVKFRIKRDNLLWKIAELNSYFEKMKDKLKDVDNSLFLCPDLSQWGYFLNIDGRTQVDDDNDYSDLWDTSVRGIDMYALSPYLDCTHFITVPVLPDGHPDAYVTSCQHSMMRVMNEGRQMIGGIYFGRYIYRDIYQIITPEEIIGTMAACGIDGYNAYGMNGLDDGGVLNQMDDTFMDSLKRGNEFLTRLNAVKKGSRKKEVAILFPLEMSDFEPFEIEGNTTRRLDLLGYYKYCCDLGYQVDVISTHEIEKGRLDDYAVLIVPANDCYKAVGHELSEKKIREFVEKGGTLIHGPLDDLAKNVFGITGTKCDKLPYYREGEKKIIPQGNAFCSYHDGEVIASYVNGESCIVSHSFGEGKVYSLGVMFGASYTPKNIPHVPYDQGNKEMYPLTLSGSNIFKDIMYEKLVPASPIRQKSLETGVFENGIVIVNHRSLMYKLPEGYRVVTGTFDNMGIPDDIVPAHTAAWIEKA